MRRASLVRTSVERTVASATTGTTSDGGCDNTDMADRTYGLMREQPIGYLDLEYVFGISGHHLCCSPVKYKRLCVKIKGSTAGQRCMSPE